MIPALTISKLENTVKKNNNQQESIIGIMMGRYNIQHIQQAIDESYTYWHLNSGNSFDIYWAGYGKWWGERSSNQFILSCANFADGVYFDLNAFVTFKKYFCNSNKIKYRDTFQLVLCNVRDGIIKYDEHIVIDLEENLNNSTAKLRDIMENVIELCKKESDVSDIKNKMKAQSFWENVRGISFSDILSLTTTAIGVGESLSRTV